MNWVGLFASPEFWGVVGSILGLVYAVYRQYFSEKAKRKKEAKARAKADAETERGRIDKSHKRAEAAHESYRKQLATKESWENQDDK